MARDDIAKMRGLAAELGYRLEPLPVKQCWQLVDEETGEVAKRPDCATAFNVCLVRLNVALRTWKPSALAISYLTWIPSA